MAGSYSEVARRFEMYSWCEMVKCTLVEQMADFLVKNGSKDSRYFKVFSGKIIKVNFSALSMSTFMSDPRSERILVVWYSERYLPSKKKKKKRGPPTCLWSGP